MVERRDLPLFAWGEALRAARRRRHALTRRAAFVALGCACVLGATMALIRPTTPLPGLRATPRKDSCKGRTTWRRWSERTFC